jgi:hypothetical protein
MRGWWGIGVVGALGVGVLVQGCGPGAEETSQTIDRAAKAYVELALSMDVHDDDYVTFYYGSPSWQEQAESSPLDLASIGEAALNLHAQLEELPIPADDLERRRLEALRQMLAALSTRVTIISGVSPGSFDEETQLLYDIVVPHHDEAYYQGILAELDEAIPGRGPLSQRLQIIERRQFPLPPEHLETVFEAALAECRRRTREHIPLPDNEHVTVEYVTDVAFGGREFYQGGNQSIIQINAGMPMTVGQALHLACHEGYPGHHVQSILMDQALLGERNWVEYTVAPLFSAGSLLVEGAGNYGVDLAFPWRDRVSFLKETLLPLAGIDPALLRERNPDVAAAYDRYQEIGAKLGSVTNDVTRGYLDGTMDRDTAIHWLVTYGLLGDPQVAGQWVDSMELYRSYVINYGYGEALVRRHVESLAGDDLEARWQVLAEMFRRPLLASDLR